MKRWILAFLVMLAASPGFGKPRVAGPNETKSNAYTLTFAIGDTEQSDAIGVHGMCKVRYVQAGGDDVSLYAITTPTASAVSGTLLRNFTTSTTTVPYEFTPGTLWVKAVATDATAGGSTLTINCSPMAGGGGGDPDPDNDGLYDFAILWDADGDGSTWTDCIGKDNPDSACKALGERIYGDFADDVNCALWGCGFGQMENSGSLYLEQGVYVNFPCWEPTNTVNIRGAPNDNTHDSIANDPASWLLCPGTPDPDTTRRFTAVALMDWQGEIIGSGVDTRNPATTPNYIRNQATYIADDRGPYWDISTPQAGNNSWFDLTNHIRGINIGFDIYPGTNSSGNVPSGETADDGDSDGTTTVSGDQTTDVLLGDLCVVENAMVTSLQAGDIVLVVSQSGTSSTSTTQVTALRVRTTSTTTDCNGAGTATINIGGRFTSGTGSEYYTTSPDSLTFKSGNYVTHARSDFRDATARIANLNLGPQDWWDEPNGDCIESGVWTLPLDGDTTNADIDCDTNDIIGFYGAGSYVLEDVVFTNHHGYSIDGNSNAGNPLIRRVRWFYGRGGIIADPGSGWNLKDIEVHESQFASEMVAAFGPGVRYDGVKVYNSSFEYFSRLTDVNTGNVFERFDFKNNTMSHAFGLNCGARMNEFRDIHISGISSQPNQSNGSVARFICPTTSDPIHDNSFTDVWVEGIGPGFNGTGLSHAAFVFDTDSVIGTSNAAAIVRNVFNNVHMNLRYTDANSEACLFGVQDDEPTTSRSVGGDFSHNAIFGNNTFFQNEVRHFGGGTDWVYCACGQFDAGGNNASNNCEDAHTGTAGGGTNPRGCGNIDNNAAPANETCS